MIECVVGYLFAHFLLYALLLRQCRAFQTERGIFLYHFVPAVVLLVVVGSRSVTSPGESFEEGVLVVALQGIYSLSFLELWSLSQGGYSIRILNAIESAREAGTEPDAQCWHDFGKGKTSLRLPGLEKLGMVRRRGDVWELTGAGTGVAACLRAIVRVVNHKSVG
jgi:hypothetical protein